MIPLRDDIPSRKYPFINTLLIAINIAVFLWEITLPSYIRENIFFKFGVLPYRFYNLNLLPSAILSLFTSMFLHGGWSHIVGNMIYLYIFGDNVEDAMGHFRYLFFYIISGIVAGLVQVLFSVNPYIPAIGASGAIAGVLGAYIRFYPGARILTIALFGFFIDFIYIPAFIYLGLWFILQLFSGFFSLIFLDLSGGIGWWAHIGGFVFGFLISKYFRKKYRYYYYYHYF
jgi:membrane associated rhomboid family serine protease